MRSFTNFRGDRHTIQTIPASLVPDFWVRKTKGFNEISGILQVLDGETGDFSRSKGRVACLETS